MDNKFSLQAQIEEVLAELEMRKRVYPRQVAARAMREGDAQYKIARMNAVLTTLSEAREKEKLASSENAS